MPEEPLPERLRELAELHGVTSTVRDALEGAADELERLAEEPEPQSLAGRMVEAARALGSTRAASLLVQGANTIERLRRRVAELERKAYPLHVIGAELAGDAGVPAPMPQPRRFAAYYAAAWPLPAPGSFVQTPPAGAVWRVLSVDEGPGPVYVDRDGGERRPSVLVLEAVDPHDVPAGARADMVPLPVQELGPEGGES